MRRSWMPLVLILLCATPALGLTPRLVKDINTMTLPGSSSPRNFVPTQSLVYFTAQDPWMFTNTTVLDPEGQTGNGVPIFRTLLIGGSLGF